MVLYKMGLVPPTSPEISDKSHEIPMFLGETTIFPMVFPWFSHGFPMVFPWFSPDMDGWFPALSRRPPGPCGSRGGRGSRAAGAVWGSQCFGGIEGKGVTLVVLAMQQEPIDWRYRFHWNVWAIFQIIFLGNQGILLENMPLYSTVPPF